MSAKANQQLKISVDEIISNLPKEERVIVQRLRSLVIECLPTATEKNTYGAPFYAHHRMICFIWPPALYWGGKNQSLRGRGVSLGFCQGNLLANDDGALLAEGRKQMYCMYFKSMRDINEGQIKALLFEAELVDNSFAKKPKSRNAAINLKRSR